MDEHTLNLGPVGVDRPKGGIEPQIQHGFLAQNTANYRFGSGNQGVQIENRRMEALSTADGEQLLSQSGALHGRRLYGREALARRMRPAGTAEKVRDMAEHYGEQIVEIVGHVSRHAPEFQRIAI